MGEKGNNTDRVMSLVIAKTLMFLTSEKALQALTGLPRSSETPKQVLDLQRKLSVEIQETLNPKP